MGADIYRRSISDAARKQYLPLFDEAVKKRNAGDETAREDVEKYYRAMYPEDGYFRDSYNNSNFLWLLGISWWRDIKTDENGFLSIDRAKAFLATLEEKPVTQELVEAHIAKLNEKERRIEPDVDGWFDRWTKDREHLMKMLRDSIESDEMLYCSL